MGVHFGGRGHPQLNRDVALTLKQLGSGAEMTNIGHARANKDFVNFGASYIRQGFGVVWIVGATHNGLSDLRQIDLQHSRVLGISVGL